MVKAASENRIGSSPKVPVDSTLALVRLEQQAAREHLNWLGLIWPLSRNEHNVQDCIQGFREGGSVLLHACIVVYK